jgi:ArsR family transcriptional regulator
VQGAPEIFILKRTDKTYQGIYIMCRSQIVHAQGTLIRRRTAMIDGTSEDRCSINVIHDDVIERVAELMPDSDKMSDLSLLYKALGDPTRLRILFALDAAEMCVCDISALLEMTQSAISHQLRILKQARLVKSRKEGKMVFYSLSDLHVAAIIEQGLRHVHE